MINAWVYLEMFQPPTHYYNMPQKDIEGCIKHLQQMRALFDNSEPLELGKYAIANGRFQFTHCFSFSNHLLYKWKIVYQWTPYYTQLSWFKGVTAISTHKKLPRVCGKTTFGWLITTRLLMCLSLAYRLAMRIYKGALGKVPTPWWKKFLIFLASNKMRYILIQQLVTC